MPDSKPGSSASSISLAYICLLSNWSGSSLKLPEAQFSSMIVLDGDWMTFLNGFLDGDDFNLGAQS